MKKVQSGDRLNIPATTYNAFVDAAMAHRQGGQFGAGHTPTSTPQNGTILIRNDTGGDLVRFGVVGIGDPVILPANNERQFKNCVAMIGETPSKEDHAGKIAIVQEPIASGKIGRAMVAGVTPVNVEMNGSNDRYAEIDDGSTAGLTSSGSRGEAVILWEESSGSADNWAIVRLCPTQSMVLFGKAKADWSDTTPNKIDLNPCDDDGGNVDTATTIAATILTPTDAEPDDVDISTGDVLAYLPYGDDDKGVLVNAPIASASIPDGTNDQDLLVWVTNEWQSKLGSDVNLANKYKVLQVSPAGTWAVDYLRAAT